VEKNTPLHIASKNNNFKMVEFLINKSCDVNKGNTRNETPLHLSCSTGSHKSCEVLLEGGAKVNKADVNGRIALHASINAPYNTVKLAKLLVDYGSDINQEDKYNYSPLALATQHGNYKLVNFLIDKQAKITNSKYESIAHMCAQTNLCNSGCMRLLIGKYGFKSFADRSLTHYRTPLQLCVEYKSHDFLRALITCDNIKCIDWFTSINSTNGLGVSPLMMAVTSQNYVFIGELVKLWFKYYDDSHHQLSNDYNYFDGDDRSDDLMGVEVNYTKLIINYY
jgi:hypothetical protein